MSKNFSFAPRLMQASAASHYLGMSESKLLELARQGHFGRKECGGNRLFDIRDLDAFADSLKYEGEEKWRTTEAADAAFGIAAE
ncbi:helix-turn-helix domain-containing protein [Maritimibacter dapengensis]|uniref:Helix-turn-helix domain-containing protein n=1 Tax=Maritimibacter dapengensis TaxID=2836868 RepID=A0ABS6T605_9RHOB|nr:helix-turn-helix domain-containing protein [Maritimibacter dapengensis]MBV7380579.1 helix-turn-helix domain-containing protein [Maritimibacter dapengensis]